MTYESIALKRVVTINKLYSIHYFEYMSDFSFAGESHDFWELLCVDKGDVVVMAGAQEHSLKKDDIIFHQPNEFHNVRSNGQTAPNLVVLSFECNSPAMEFFREKIVTIGESERNLLAQIIMESRKSFVSPLEYPYSNTLVHSPEQPFGSEQLIQIYLEQLLIQLIRRHTTLYPREHVPDPSADTAEHDLYSRILNYLELHICTQITIDQICKDNLVSRSQLQKLFREKNGCGIIDTFSHMKISTAKQLIRNKRLNFTQIADTLGYTSVHYFSRQFKKITGMTPSEYASSIKKLSEMP